MALFPFPPWYVETRIVPDVSDRSEAAEALPLACTLCLPIHCALATHADYIITNPTYVCNILFSIRSAHGCVCVILCFNTYGQRLYTSTLFFADFRTTIYQNVTTGPQFCIHNGDHNLSKRDKGTTILHS